MEQKKPKKQLNSIAKYSGIGFQMVIIIGAGVFGGYHLDNYLNTTPIFVLILSVTSVVLAIYYAIKDIIKFNP